MEEMLFLTKDSKAYKMYWNDSVPTDLASGKHLASKCWRFRLDITSASCEVTPSTPVGKILDSRFLRNSDLKKAVGSNVFLEDFFLTF